MESVSFNNGNPCRILDMFTGTQLGKKGSGVSFQVILGIPLLRSLCLMLQVRFPFTFWVSLFLFFFINFFFMHSHVEWLFSYYWNDVFNHSDICVPNHFYIGCRPTIIYEHGKMDWGGSNWARQWCYHCPCWKQNWPCG